MNIEIINTNIHDYSIDELYNILNLNQANITKEEIIQRVEFLKSNFFSNKPKVIEFLTKIENKLLENIINSNINSNIIENFQDAESVSASEDAESVSASEDAESVSGSEDAESVSVSASEDAESVSVSVSASEFTTSKTPKIINDKSDSYIRENIDNILIEKKPEYIKNYFYFQFLHFNTEFRTPVSYGESTLDSNNIDSQANSTFQLSTPINNIHQLKLSSINFKKPYLISEYKENNKFKIKKYSDEARTICDASYVITLEDGYYYDHDTLKEHINTNIQNNAIEVSNIVININTNSEKITFTSTDISYFEIDFLSYYTSKYSLAYILGFDKNINSYYTLNGEIIAPYKTSINDTNDYFFCFNEYKSNIIETHKLYLDRYLSKQKILAKISSLSANKSNNFFINETLSINDLRYDVIRLYSGLINLSKFEIKIIDYYGNIINTQNSVTFTLEVKIFNSKLINQSYFI
tara:strand:- start:37 stop:1440 length:1404 start_codon:yes stop_codon:yes gene_type:complete